MAHQALDPAFRRLIDEHAPVRQAGSGFTFTEGPIWHPVDHYLLFSDMPGDVRRRLDGAGVREVMRPSNKGNGMTYDADLNLLVCEHATSSVARFRPDGTREVLASHYKGQELNSPNDICVKSDGSIWFTDPWYGRMPHYGVERPRQLGWQGVFRLKPGHRPGDEPDLMVDRFTFTNTLIGYGLRDYLTLYVLFPFGIKEQDTLGKSSGMGDPEIFLHYGFKYGAREGFKGWYPFNEDDVAGKEYTQADWKFGLHASMTIPFGDIGNKDNNGSTFPMGMQPGFAVPSYNFTAIMSKMITSHLTFNMDTAFRAFALAPGADGGKPGNEWRVNGALTYEVFEDKDTFLSRVDLVGEANFLNLQKDLDSERIQDDATGGSMLYLSPGLRLTLYDRASLGVLIKFPTVKNLNNEDQQQGAEGLEKYRAVATFSLSF